MELLSNSKLQVTLPDGQVVTIRETNGADEDIISKMGDVRNNTAIANFLSNIIVSESISSEQIMFWPLCKKYYLLLKSRIHSLGAILDFKYEFNNPKTNTTVPHPLSIDLTSFDADLEKYFKGSESEKAEFLKNLTIDQIKPLKNSLKEHEFFVGNHRFKFSLLDSYGEIMLQGKEEDLVTINDELRIRKVSIYNDGEWVVIENFSSISSRVMAEIRAKVTELENRFNMELVISNPFDKTRGDVKIQLIQLPDFFFPRTH